MEILSSYPPLSPPYTLSLFLSFSLCLSNSLCVVYVLFCSSTLAPMDSPTPLNNMILLHHTTHFHSKAIGILYWHCMHPPESRIPFSNYRLHQHQHPHSHYNHSSSYNNPNVISGTLNLCTLPLTNYP